MDNADQQKFWTDDAGPAWVARLDATDRMFAPVMSEVLEAAAIGPGAYVLDIGCGGGTSTLLAADLAGANGKVCGLDISPTLLAAAKARTKTLAQVSFELADAQTTVFEPIHSHLISRFGLMFFADPPRAFANMAEALKPDGRMAFATWGAIPENPMFTMPARVAAEVIGKPPKSDPDGPGPLSLRDVAKVTGLLEQAGLTDITAQEVPMMLTPEGTADEVADLLCDIGSAQRALAYFEADAADRARLATALSDALQDFVTPEGIRIPALINMFMARKAA